MTTATLPATPPAKPSDALAPIQLVPITSLRPSPRNARKHPKKQIRQIAASITEFGFTNPILVDADGGVIAGHGRLEAAQQLGLAEVPVRCLAHLSPAQVRAYVIADNRLAENAGWDHELLRVELEELADLDFDLQLTGFDTPALDGFLSPMLADEEEPAPLVSDQPPVSRVGDLWDLGAHRLLCGDSTDPASYERLMDGGKAQVVFTDPPYNVPIAGNVSSQGRHGEFVMASGEMSSEQFTAFLRTIFSQLVAHSVDGSLHFVCMDWRHLGEMHAAQQGTYAELKNLVVWNKANAGMGSLYRSKHELVFVYKAGTAGHINNIELGKHGRNRTNVWNYAGANTPSKGRAQRLEMHPTVKPVSMIADALQDASHRGGLVLDPFGGSGSTLIAAQNTGRRARLIELDPRYVDVIVRRWERLGLGPALVGGSERTFAQVAAERRQAAPAERKEVSHG